MTNPANGSASGDEAAKPIAVFLLDDHEIVRRGVRDLLEAEPDIRVVGEAGTASSALARIPALRPDVAVLDVRLPDGDGVSVCREIRSKMPEVACLMLTSFGDDEALFDAIMAGAAGYVLKQIRGTDLVGAVRTVASGQSMLDPKAASRLMARLRDQSRQARSAGRADRAGAADPGADRRGPDQPADRRADVPGREDGEELRVGAVRQARHGAPHPGGGLRGPRLRRSTPAAASGTWGPETEDHVPVLTGQLPDPRCYAVRRPGTAAAVPDEFHARSLRVQPGGVSGEVPAIPAWFPAPAPSDRRLEPQFAAELLGSAGQVAQSAAPGRRPRCRSRCR